MKNLMARLNLRTVLIFCLLTLLFSFWSDRPAQSWGFWAHKRINRLAVFTLPPEMIGFYKKHIEFLTEHAVDPDKRRYATEDEAGRHFIDIDHYGTYPFPEMPRRWDDAIAKYSEDTIKEYGIVPWHTQLMLYKLTRAFEQKDVSQILHLSADIGHYIGDGHVPLHTTENYNGLKTNQRGIHGFWESRIPELYGEEYDYWVGKADYIKKPLDEIWTYVLESHLALDSVLTFERELNARFPPDQKKCYEARGATTMEVYCEGYTHAYSDELEGMVERRMRRAILHVGSFWYTAWVNAGKPDLNNIGPYAPTPEEQREQEELEKKFEAGQSKGRKC